VYDAFVASWDAMHVQPLHIPVAALEREIVAEFPRVRQVDGVPSFHDLGPNGVHG
jgi:hypothetical protein